MASTGEGATRCPRHPDRPVGGTCKRCGSYLCIDCSPDLLRRDDVTCPDCVRRKKNELRPVKLKRALRDVAGTSALFGVLIFGIVGLIPLLLTSEAGSSLVFLIIGGALALPFFGGGALVWFLRSPVLAWIAFALQALVALPLIVVGGVNLISAILLGTLAGTFWKCFVIHDLTRAIAGDE